MLMSWGFLRVRAKLEGMIALAKNLNQRDFSLVKKKKKSLIKTKQEKQPISWLSKKKYFVL